MRARRRAIACPSWGRASSGVSSRFSRRVPGTHVELVDVAPARAAVAAARTERDLVFHASGRAAHRMRLGLALSLLADARLDPLIDGEAPFDALPATLPELAAHGGLCRRVRY
jgi:hypothetical protein